MSAPRSQSCVRLRSGFIHVLEKGERAMAQRDALLALRSWLNHRILGQEALVDRLLIALLSDGHLLVEGAPGLAKTRAIKDLALGVEGSFHRIQFTPDLLPSDVTGTDIFSPETGQFSFQEGPIFHNLVLADEINRAPAKVQSALLEAMAEGQVSAGRRSLELPELFLVMATQNPIEQEGTYPLPEAQLDRFLLNVLGPTPMRKRNSASFPWSGPRPKLWQARRRRRPSPRRTFFAARQAVLSLHMDPAVETYLVQLILATRNPALWGEDLARWIEYGASPRGTLALDRCARARGLARGPGLCHTGGHSSAGPRRPSAPRARHLRSPGPGHQHGPRVGRVAGSGAGRLSMRGAVPTLPELLALRAAATRLVWTPPRTVRAGGMGQRSSRFRGRGIDFAETRAYQPGDDIRHIDWRVTAWRTGRVHTKVFHEERERPSCSSPISALKPSLARASA